MANWLASLTVKLPEIWPLPPGIGSFTFGQEMIFLIQDNRQKPSDMIGSVVGENFRAVRGQT